MDLGVGRPVRPGRRRLLTAPRNTGLSDWLGTMFGTVPDDLAPFERALTHGSSATANYERLEFLGDRVLGLLVAEWLWESFPAEPEGQLSKRFNALVTGAVCAAVAREIGVRDHLRLGKQARDDGAIDSDNVLGDVMEALIGAWYRAAGLDAARVFVRRVWGDRVRREAKAPQHPKSALQEWAAAAGRRAAEYTVIDRSGPGHAPRFVVKVAIGSHASA